jgi:hypothetical protein
MNLINYIEQVLNDEFTFIGRWTVRIVAELQQRFCRSSGVQNTEGTVCSTRPSVLVPPWNWAVFEPKVTAFWSAQPCWSPGNRPAYKRCLLAPSIFWWCKVVLLQNAAEFLSVTSSETSVSSYQTTRHSITADTFYTRHLENLISHQHERCTDVLSHGLVRRTRRVVLCQS